MSVPSTATDTELFAALRGGEPSALDELFRRHYVILCRTAVRLVRDYAAAEDIVQDCLPSYGPSERIFHPTHRPWVLTSVPQSATEA